MQLDPCIKSPTPTERQKRSNGSISIDVDVQITVGFMQNAFIYAPLGIVKL